jgi:hypothetical protein
MADGWAGRAWSPGESTYAPEVGRAICARVAAGESLTRMCKAADLPCRGTVRNWSRNHPEFGGALMAAMKAARTASRLADRARWNAHEARRRPRGRGSTYTPEIGEAICLRLAHGESLTSIGRDPALPTYATILRWVSRHADFQDMYVQARRIQADWLFDESRDVALAATPGNVWVARLQFDIIRWQTARLAPKKYCEKLLIEAARGEDDVDQVLIAKFVEGPNGEPLVIPPRNGDEERRWEAAHGRPYDGPRP